MDPQCKNPEPKNIAEKRRMGPTNIDKKPDNDLSDVVFGRLMFEAKSADEALEELDMPNLPFGLGLGVGLCNLAHSRHCQVNLSLLQNQKDSEASGTTAWQCFRGHWKFGRSASPTALSISRNRPAPGADFQEALPLFGMPVVGRSLRSGSNKQTEAETAAPSSPGPSSRSVFPHLLSALQPGKHPVLVISGLRLKLHKIHSLTDSSSTRPEARQEI